MLFHTWTFILFFAAFLLLYHLCRNNLQWRNVLIVIASYVFYGWWDFRFLTLLVLSSVVDFYVGLALGRTDQPRRRRLILWVSLAGNLGLLGFFKYYGFFVESFSELLRGLGIDFHPLTLNIVLPVGISFYTFQTMSYTLDVYRREIQPVRNMAQFLAYVSFFPQLVAGPIERAQHLLPQFEKFIVVTRSMLSEGIWLILWGLFKKTVIADNLAPLVEMVFDRPSPADLTAPGLILGTLAFALQIYGDFSGYSDIARGLGKTLGFELMFNFNVPYFSRSVREFWSRWHISLSTWLRDYLYIPLGGNRGGRARSYLNLFLTMLLGGLWHGASWNFVLWGTWHGAGLMIQRAWSSKYASKLPGPLNWLLTFSFVLYGWLLFRASSWKEIQDLTSSLMHWELPAWFGSYLTTLIVFVVPLYLIEAWQWRRQDLLAPLRSGLWTRALLQGAILIAILLYWEKESTPFIYFQF